MKKIILIAGPSGAGKTSIAHYLKTHYQIPRVVTHTTRPRRPDEKDGSSYYFETPASFKKLHLFEAVKYNGYLYGSSREGLKRAWQKSDLVSLIVEIQGVESYLQKLGQQVYFLYVTAAKDELRQRLLKRGDSPALVQKRLTGAALNTLPSNLQSAAHILHNDDWTKTKMALDQLVARLNKD